MMRGVLGGVGRLFPGQCGYAGLGVGHGMCLRGLGSRELGSPAMNSDSHLSRDSQGKGSRGQR